MERAAEFREAPVGRLRARWRRPATEEAIMEIRPLCGALGAEVDGISLAGLDDAGWRAVHDAFLEHHVLVFRDQPLSRDELLGFAQRLGAPEVHPIVEGTEAHPEVIRVHKPAGASASFGVGWHSDNSFFETPSLGTVLHGVTVPPQGGDTLFANLERAYDTLSEPIQRLLEPLDAVHCAMRAYDPALTGTDKYEGKGPLRYRWSESIREEVRHPVIRVHPETGRRSIYVNPMFTERIDGLRPAESDALLQFLYAHCATPDWSCRVRWAPETITMWDNRCLWHYAMDDYQEHERLMFRVTIAGDRPAGAHGRAGARAAA